MGLMEYEALYISIKPFICINILSQVIENFVAASAKLLE